MTFEEKPRKKRHYYDSYYDYCMKEIPGFHGWAQANNASLLSQKKYLRKRWLKLQTFYMK